MSKKCIYTPAAIKKDFNLRIYCELKNLFYICYIDHLIILTNSSLSLRLVISYHGKWGKARTVTAGKAVGRETLLCAAPFALRLFLALSGGA